MFSAISFGFGNYSGIKVAVTRPSDSILSQLDERRNPSANPARLQRLNETYENQNFFGGDQPYRFDGFFGRDKATDGCVAMSNGLGLLHIRRQFSPPRKDSQRGGGEQLKKFVNFLLCDSLYNVGLQNELEDTRQDMFRQDDMEDFYVLKRMMLNSAGGDLLFCSAL